MPAEAYQIEESTEFVAELERAQSDGSLVPFTAFGGSSMDLAPKTQKLTKSQHECTHESKQSTLGKR
jgi:hypothetical protein